VLCVLSFLRRSPGKQNRAASKHAASGAGFGRSRIPPGNDDLCEDGLRPRGFHAALRSPSLWEIVKSEVGPGMPPACRDGGLRVCVLALP